MINTYYSNIASREFFDISGHYIGALLEIHTTLYVAGNCLTRQSNDIIKQK